MLQEARPEQVLQKRTSSQAGVEQLSVRVATPRWTPGAKELADRHSCGNGKGFANSTHIYI